MKDARGGLAVIVDTRAVPKRVTALECRHRTYTLHRSIESLIYYAPISADTALRLGKYFGVSPDIWVGLEGDDDLRVAQRKIGPEVEKPVPGTSLDARTESRAD